MTTLYTREELFDTCRPAGPAAGTPPAYMSRRLYALMPPGVPQAAVDAWCEYLMSTDPLVRAAYDAVCHEVRAMIEQYVTSDAHAKARRDELTARFKRLDRTE